MTQLFATAMILKGLVATQESLTPEGVKQIEERRLLTQALEREVRENQVRQQKFENQRVKGQQPKQTRNHQRSPEPVHQPESRCFRRR